MVVNRQSARSLDVHSIALNLLSKFIDPCKLELPEAPLTAKWTTPPLSPMGLHQKERMSAAEVTQITIATQRRGQHAAVGGSV